jgi:antitoxin component of MazEF toxin-antitoxin module
MTDYKKYSLKQLENFLYDAMSTEATPQEIYDVIKGAVQDNYYTYKKQASDAYELLALLNGNGVGHLTCDKDDTSPECKEHWNDFWEEHHQQYTDEEMDAMCDAATSAKKDKVKKWILPVEEVDCDECIINLPDDLLEAANLVEGDIVEWIDNNDGSYTMKKQTKPLGMEEC